jgi:hypothetical protein
MKILIGNTGLVGKTLKKNISFDIEFNSSNINYLKNINIDNSDLYLSCLPATKWLVNKDPVQDLKIINSIFNIISNYKYNKIILISTIDIYNNSPLLSNEDYIPKIKHLNYGSNRLLFEYLLYTLNYNSIQIFRLPAIFGDGLKKNIIFDLLNNNNINQININSIYQWFDLNDLNFYIEKFRDVQGAINLFPEPLETIDILKLFNFQIKNSYNRIEYNYMTKYDNSGYIYQKEDSLKKIKDFIYEYRNNSTGI